MAGSGLYRTKTLLDYAGTIEVPSSRPVPHSVEPEVDWVAIVKSLRASNSSATSDKPLVTWTPSPDSQWMAVAPHPSTILIIGKSALGYRLLELYRDQAAPYVVGLPSSAGKLLPEWVGVMDRLEDVPSGAVVLLDEAYIQLHARDSMSRGGRDEGTIVNLSRQGDRP